MAIVNGYVTLVELKRWLRLLLPESPHDDDPLFEQAIESVSRYVDERCRRHFFQITEARRFERTDAYTLALGTYGDLVSVTTLATDEDGTGIFAEVWTTDDYELYPVNTLAGAEHRPYREVRAIGRQFPRNAIAGGRAERIEVTGVWGWPEIPSAIAQATKIQAARIVKRKEAPEGIVGLNQFGVLSVSGRQDPDVMAMIGPYRLRSVG